MQKINFKSFITSKKFIIVASFIGLFLVSVGLSLIVFYLVAPKEVSGILNKVNQKTKINLNLPKTEECPINGEKYTKVESDVWNTRRPVIAVIENHLDARPVTGLSRADVVYEAVAEGGITRFLSVFYCGVSAEDVQAAPIRSARIYFVNLAAGYGTDPIFLHQGGANNFCPDCPGGVKTRGEIDPSVDAYGALDKLGWRNGTKGNDMDGGFNIGFPIVVRDQYRLSSTPAAWEHSVVADLNEVYVEASRRNFNYKDESGTAWTKGFRKWLFQDGKATTSPTAGNITFNFWESMPGYDVEWKYDSASNSYARFNGGKAQVDWQLDKPQITAENVAIMFVQEKGPVDRELHMFYQVTGTGKAIVFQNGQAITGTWKKTTPLDREIFYDTTGEEIKMVRGATWVELVPAQNKVTY
jgi:hypothetical protein